MHHHLSLRSKLIIMLSVMASLFLVALDQTIVATALGKIVEEFNAFDSLSWIVTAYLVTTTVTVPLAGKLSDLFGRRRILLIGVAIFTLGSLLAGTSTSITELVLLRALQGIGGGIITANAFTIVGDLFAARERGKWQGLIGAVFGLSSIVGPLLGGWLTDSNVVLGMTTDWRWTFFINVPIGILAFLLISIFCPPLKHDRNPKVDYAGASLLTIGLATLILAVDNTENIFAGFMETTGLSLLGLRVIMFSVVAVAIFGFIMTERRAKEPVLPIDFFKNKNYVLIIAVAALFGSAFLGSILYLTQFNQQVFGATPTESGLMLMPMVGGLMLTSILSGQVISRTGRYKLFMQAGLAVATIGMIMLTTLNPGSAYGYEAIIMVILGLGLGVAMPVLNLAVQNEFSQHDIGAATSSNQLFRSLGSTIGVAIFGAMLTAGVTANIGSAQELAYVNSIRFNPQASKIGSLDDANTLLTLNMPDVKERITDQAMTAFEQLPTPVGEAAKKQFVDSQNEFADKVETAFSDSLRQIFISAAVLMSIAFLLTSLLEEKELRQASPTDTPGEI